MVRNFMYDIPSKDGVSINFMFISCSHCGPVKLAPHTQVNVDDGKSMHVLSPWHGDDTHAWNSSVVVNDIEFAANCGSINNKAIKFWFENSIFWKPYYVIHII